MRPLSKIVKTSAESACFQDEWDRQMRTAEEILARYEAGIDTVLLADEVGMGKTYVALATIASNIFQTDANDRKVLLVVPPNNTLASKWEQEISSFNEKYLNEEIHNRGGKSLRPVVVSDYWDLICNLHDFDNVDTPRVSQDMLANFSRAVWAWNDQRREKRTWSRAWKDVDYDPDSLGYLNFCSRISPSALSEFLDEHAGNPSFVSMLKSLNSGNREDDKLKALFKEFSQKQDQYEHNIFVMGMGTLRRTRSDKREARLFTMYLASVILMRRQVESSKKMAMCHLLNGGVGRLPAGVTHDEDAALDWFSELGGIDLWGMRDSVCAVLERRGDRLDLGNRIIAGHNLKPLFDELRSQVIEEKLRASGICLAVVDEVHNWKSRANGAEAFASSYADAIPRKLIMSATPFQLDESELGTIFSLVSPPEHKSRAIVQALLGETGPAESALVASQAFLEAWRQLNPNDQLRLKSASDAGNDVGEALRQLRHASDLSDELMALVDCALAYRGAINSLQGNLSKVVIRHTKRRDIRHFHAGRDYAVRGNPAYSKPRRALYATHGYGSESSAMLNYIAMRVDQRVRAEISNGKQDANAHLMGGLTSSNAACGDSNKRLLEDEALSAALSAATLRYLGLFRRELERSPHPKVEATVERAFHNFMTGQKTLIFCERIGTLKEIINSLEQRIDREVFRAGGHERARKDRETILKDHSRVELFWSRSWLLARKGNVAKQRARITAATNELLATANSVLASLGGTISRRQAHKVLDLVLLRALVQQDEDDAGLVAALVDEKGEALQRYLRIKNDKDAQQIDPTDTDAEPAANSVNAGDIDEILDGESIWHAHPEPAAFHDALWQLVEQEIQHLPEATDADKLYMLAEILLDLPQGLRKVLLRLDVLQAIQVREREAAALAAIRVLNERHAAPELSSWLRTHEFIKALVEAEGSIRRLARNSRRHGLWKGVFLSKELIAAAISGGTDRAQRSSLCAAFNSPLLPDILVCTAIGSEGIDLHRHCADIIHHDLPWNPAKLEQRIGRIDRVGSLAEKTKEARGESRLHVGIPFLAHNYEQFQYDKLLVRAQKFEILLGTPEFHVEIEETATAEDGTEVVKELAADSAEPPAEQAEVLPEKLIEFLKMDLTVAPKAGMRTV